MAVTSIIQLRFLRIIGLVVKFNVAIVEPRVRFPDDALVRVNPDLFFYLFRLFPNLIISRDFFSSVLFSCFQRMYRCTQVALCAILWLCVDFLVAEELALHET